MAQHTDEIDDGSPVAEASRGMAEESHAVRRLVMPRGDGRYELSSHDNEIAGVDVRVSEGKHGGEVARVGGHTVEA